MAPTSSSDEFEIFDADGFDELDALERDYASGAKLPPRTHMASETAYQQRDLFGNIVTVTPAKTKSSTAIGSQIPTPKVKVIKKWDRANFARHGWSKKNAAATKARAKKGKKRAGGEEGEDWDDPDQVMDDDSDEDVMLDLSYDPDAPVAPIKWPPDADASQTWQYPVQPDKPLRKYQYDIVHRALFENTLVSLPTGLGKTFIAACVMLNFYRWYPKGKILFMAPTRPLVTQQIKACHYICGIKQSDSVELTGMTAPQLRAIAWEERRVVYCTPQTAENDLRKGRLDPRDVTLVVVDEAHRASGDYAYVGVIRYLMSRNTHFRVLALTATPGAKGEAVQDVIDNLHIGRIEVRTDESMDIVQYIHRKSYDLMTVPLGDTLTNLRDRWVNLMRSSHSKLIQAGIMYSTDTANLSPFACTSAMGKVNSLPGGSRANGQFYPMLKNLGMMARALEYLIIESVTSFATQAKDVQANGYKTICETPTFRDILREVSAFQNTPNYVGHPKMHHLRDMCIKHFNDHANQLDDYGQPLETRIMVFCNFRSVVEEIVETLNQQRPLIKATPFVGQSTSKGSKGFTQREQIETIAKFKKGVYNVLVATSIGEEGLDIGEIDLIVCYEANKSPIRMLQRVGRTGRARDGRIIVLMTEGREEKNWDKANDAYNEVQNALVSRKVFELYADGERMLPQSCKPQVDKIHIEAKPLDLDAMTMNGFQRTERREKKEKKPPKVFAKPPANAFLGFRTAGQLEQALKEEDEEPENPAQSMRERKEAAYNTTEQDQWLRENWRTSGGSKVVGTVFDRAQLEFDRTEAVPALKIKSHSTRHDQLVSTSKAIASVDERLGEENFDGWHAKMSSSFNAKLVDVWDGKRQGDKVPFQRMAKPPLEQPPSSATLGELSSSNMPLPTYIPKKKQPAPLLSKPAATTSLPILSRELFSSSPEPGAPPRPIYKSATNIFAPPKTAQPKTAQPKSILKPAPPPVAPTPAAVSRARAEAMIKPESSAPDPHGMLSSDDEVKSAIATNPSTDYDMDDDFGFDISDSEMLASVVFKGRSASPVVAKSRPAGEVITLTTDEEDEKPVAVQRALFQPSSPIQSSPPVMQQARAAPAQNGDLDVDFDDEYSFFDLPDDALDAALDVAPEAIRGRGRSVAPVENKAQRGEVLTLPDSSQPIDDSVLMPPPVVEKKGKKANQQQQQYRARPRHHIVPDSSSSQASRATQPTLDSPLAIKPNKGGALSFKSAKPMAIPSSSPDVVGPGVNARGVLPPMTDTPEQSAPKQLNRLRRGRKVIDVNTDDEEGDVPKEKPAKKKRKKLPKLDAKSAHRTGLFDVEVVNSDADRSEASSEEYDSENSEDRRFLASQETNPQSDSPGQAQFYRDSLLSQAPPEFLRSAVKQGAYRMRMGHGRGGYLGTPQTPIEQEEWSYDSFCVDDDAPIEYDDDHSSDG